MSWQDSRQRREEVRRAYAEGHKAGLDMRDEAEAWDVSRARQNLAIPLPPGKRFCQCGSEEFRLASRSDKWICARCLRDADPVPRTIPDDRLPPGTRSVGDALDLEARGHNQRLDDEIGGRK